jgi:hypothetical protein
MQLAASEALDLSREPKSMHDLYGTDDAEAGIHARQLLLARRLAERGVRFVQVLLNGQLRRTSPAIATWHAARMALPRRYSRISANAACSMTRW